MTGITKGELEMIAAWWHIGTVKGAADLLGLSESTAKNQLYTARMRSGVTNTLALARMHAKDLPSMAVLRRRGLARARKAA